MLLVMNNSRLIIFILIATAVSVCQKGEDGRLEEEEEEETAEGREDRGGIDEEQLQERVDLHLLRGPYFDRSVSRNITALVGRNAYLFCRVCNLGNRTVSWIRHRDLHLLTVGSYTYTSDQRFFTTHSPQTEEWTLQIRFPQIRDSGVYECQIGTNPPMGIPMHLTVVEPVTKIIGSPDLHINFGSTINLTCMVIHSPVPPPSITWTLNDKEVNYDSPRGGVSVITEKGDVTTSYLLIQRARYEDSGSYKCIPSNANPLSIYVHVMNEKPEAMQRGFQQNIIVYPSVIFVSIGMICFFH